MPKSKKEEKVKSKDKDKKESSKKYQAPAKVVNTAVEVSLETKLNLSSVHESLMTTFSAEFLSKYFAKLTESVKRIQQFSMIADQAGKGPIADKTKEMLRTVQGVALASERSACSAMLEECNDMNHHLNYLQQKVDACKPNVSKLSGSDKEVYTQSVAQKDESISFKQGHIAEFCVRVNKTLSLIEEVNNKINSCLGQSAAPKASVYTAGAGTAFAPPAKGSVLQPIQQQAATSVQKKK